MDFLIERFKSLGYNYRVTENYLFAWKVEKYSTTSIAIPIDEIDFYIQELKLK